MRFVHSFWTKPALRERWNIQDQIYQDIWPFALSVHYVKKHGHEIILHTDTLGECVFGFLPYDAIYRTLDSLEVNEMFYAAAKVEALRREPIGAVHIDGDVFLKQPSIYDAIAADGCDLVVQSEYLSSFGLTEEHLRPYLVRFLPPLFASSETYNCGVLCFRRDDLRSEFVEAYRRIAVYLSRSRTLVETVRNNKKLVPDLIVEQRLLRVLAEHAGCEVHKLLPPLTNAAHVNRDDYEHLMYLYKYRELPDIQARLKAENPELAAAVEDWAVRLGENVPAQAPEASPLPRRIIRPAESADKIAIITPYYKETPAMLERCINSVSRQTRVADHFMIADGFPQDWIDRLPGVRHIKLDRSHANAGNTPRAIGAMLAIGENYTAIGMLDADNWLEPNHVEVCLAAAETTATDCDYVIARRFFHRPDETEMPLDEEAYHVDTSCFFFLRGAFCVIPHWGMMPGQVAPDCDRVFYNVIRQWNLVAARVPTPTVHFETRYIGHYRHLNETPPANSKFTDFKESIAWLRALPPREYEIACRMIGFYTEAGPAPPYRRVPRLSAVLPE